MDKIKLDEKTLNYLAEILKRKNDFIWLKNEISKKLTSDQKSKLNQEFDQAFTDMERIYNEYKK